MFVIDANVLLYAVNSSSTQHAAAKAWLDDVLSAREAVGFAWVVSLAFLRISTRAGILPRPLTIQEGADTLSRWLASGPAVVVSPTARHLDLLTSLLLERGTGGNLTTDAHLATLALEHSATLVSFDRDFGRFRGLRWLVPGADGVR